MSISRFNAVEKASNRKAVEAVTPEPVSYTHLRAHET